MHRLLFTPKKDKKAAGSAEVNGNRPSLDDVYVVEKQDVTETMFETSSSPMKLFTSDQKASAIKKRLKKENLNLPAIGDAHIQFAARSKFSDGNEDRAYRLLLVISDSINGTLRPYNPDIHMLGAINRNNVTCWFDSLLFAMFGRLNSFESMLLRDFEGPRKRLVIFLRIWVNLLRSGELITSDITEHIQETLKRCGWKEAADLCQHDVSEAFSFITGVLDLPLITMEMELYHSGKEDKDDHKIITERLLEVAIPQIDSNEPITLEDCLEEHFNTRVEVMRRMEGRDAFTSRGALSPLSEYGTDEKPPIDDSVESVFDEPVSIASPALSRQTSTPINRPTFARGRAQSIVRRIVVPSDDGGSTVSSPMPESPKPMSIADSTRKSSIRKEVMIPAWQFFRILPWYTADVPSNDAQVAAHFSTNPVIGICLKRYGCTNQGVPYRSKTIVDIPLQIALPYFIQDDRAVRDTSLFRDFKLVLQSMVCHRGISTDAGHYVSVVRGLAMNEKRSKSGQNASQQSAGGSPPEYREDSWYMLDDLLDDRVQRVDIERVLKVEMPYLLFYQVQPMLNNELQPQGKPPPYQAKDTSHQRISRSLESPKESNAVVQSGATQDPGSTQESGESVESSPGLTPDRDVPKTNGIAVTVQNASPTDTSPEFSDQRDEWQHRTSETLNSSTLSVSSAAASPRVSFNATHAERLHASFSETDIADEVVKPANDKEQLGRRLSRAASRFSLNGKRRQTSRTDEARKSGTFSRFNPMKSKDAGSKEKDLGKKTAENSSADASKTASVVDIVALDGSDDSRNGHSSRPQTSDGKTKVEVLAVGEDEPRKSTADETGNKNRHWQHHRFRSGQKAETSDGLGSEKVPDRECSLM